VPSGCSLSTVIELNANGEALGRGLGGPNIEFAISAFHRRSRSGSQLRPSSLSVDAMMEAPSFTN
jgi:hypothetical protein